MLHLFPFPLMTAIGGIAGKAVASLSQLVPTQ